jgi:hypothetical protein
VEFPHKADVLMAVGWAAEAEVNQKRIYRVEVTACLSRTYEIEADDEDDARENYREGDLVDEDEDVVYEDIESVKAMAGKVAKP